MDYIDLFFLNDIIPKNGFLFVFKKFPLKNEKDWWIDFVADYSSGCGYTKILQDTDTCVINSVLNGLFLSTRTREILRKLVLQDKSLQEDSLSLPLEKFETSRSYIYSLFYSLFLNGKKRSHVKGKNIPENVRSKTEIPPEDFYNIVTIPIEIFKNTFSEKMYRFVSYSDLEEIKTEKRDRRKIVPEILLILNPEKTEDFIELDDQMYSLEFCIIRIDEIKKKSEEPEGHAVVGIKCGDTLKICDSNFVNMISVYWSSDNPFYKSDIKRAMNSIYKPYKIKFCFGVFGYSVYVRTMCF